MGGGDIHKADLTLGAALLAAGAGFLAVSEAPSWPLVFVAWLLIVPGVWLIFGGFLKAVFPGLVGIVSKWRKDHPVRRVQKHSKRWRDSCSIGLAENNRHTYAFHIDGPAFALGRFELTCEVKGEKLPAARATAELQSQGPLGMLGPMTSVYLPDDFEPKPPFPLPEGKYTVRWIAPVTKKTVTRRTIRIGKLGGIEPSRLARAKKTWKEWRSPAPEEDPYG